MTTPPVTPPAEPLDLDEAKRLCADATPGPWRLVRDGQNLRLESPAGGDEIASWTFAIAPWRPEEWDECDLRDQEFIAAARDLVPRLADEVERLRAQLIEAQMDLSNAAYDSDRASKWGDRR